jgi:hypothetical protein
MVHEASLHSATLVDYIYMGVSINGGTPIASNSWTVYFIEKSQAKMDDNEGCPHFRKPPDR